MSCSIPSLSMLGESGVWTFRLTRQKGVLHLLSTGVHYQKYVVFLVSRGQRLIRLRWPCVLHSMQVWLFGSLAKESLGYSISTRVLSMLCFCTIQAWSRAQYYTMSCLCRPYVRVCLSVSHVSVSYHMLWSVVLSVSSIHSVVLPSNQRLVSKWEVVSWDNFQWKLSNFQWKLSNL